MKTTKRETENTKEGDRRKCVESGRGSIKRRARESRGARGNGKEGRDFQSNRTSYDNPKQQH